MHETEPNVPIENISAENLQLVVPNLHRRYSGVTATSSPFSRLLKCGP